jgi:hypothetical protein
LLDESLVKGNSFKSNSPKQGINKIKNNLKEDLVGFPKDNKNTSNQSPESKKSIVNEGSSDITPANKQQTFRKFSDIKLYNSIYNKLGTQNLRKIFQTVI